MSTGAAGESLIRDPTSKRPRPRIDFAAIVIGLLVAMTPEPSNAILVGVLAGAVLLTVKWVRRKWTVREDEP